VKYDSVKLDELADIAGYIKYGTRLEDNIPLFENKLVSYLYDFLIVPTDLSNNNLSITNLLSPDSNQSFVVVDNNVDGISVLFSVFLQKNLHNRVDRVVKVSGAKYSGYKYLSSGDVLFSFSAEGDAGFLFCLVGDRLGELSVLSSVKVDKSAQIFEDGTDFIIFDDEEVRVLVEDGIFSFVSEDGTLVVVGEKNEQSVR
jgi:hypothetical protein